MRTINRSVFIVRPKEPYLRWSAGLDDDAEGLAETLRNHGSVYLVPEEPEGEEETPPVADYFQEIFAAELAAWSTDESSWPEKRDLRTFHEWFEVIGESMVNDLAEGPLEHDEW